MQITLVYGATEWPPINVDTDSTVDDIRDEFGASFGIPEDAKGVVNGVEQDDSFTLRNGDKLEFRKKTGDKG